MKKIIVILLVILILLPIAVFGIYFSHLYGKMDTVEISTTDEDLGITKEILEDETSETKKEKSKIMNIALFGIDRRNADESGRSDSIMIASLDATDSKNKKVKLTSIMRDTYVDIPELGMDKINHAYAYGGPELSIKTINQNFNLDIREFAAVDFEGLVHIIDALGGIEVTIKDYEIDHIPGSFAGTQVLDGKQALAYTRIRYSGDGDYERTERQRSILEEIIKKVLSADITEYHKIINTVLPYVETSFSKSEILELGVSNFKADVKNIEKFRIPADGYGTGLTINEIYYLVPETLEDNVRLMHEFIYGN